MPAFVLMVQTNQSSTTYRLDWSYFLLSWLLNNLTSTLQDRLEKLQTGESEAATNIPVDIKHYKIFNEKCPSIVRAVLVTALVHIEHDPCEFGMFSLSFRSFFPKFLPCIFFPNGIEWMLKFSPYEILPIEFHLQLFLHQIASSDASQSTQRSCLILCSLKKIPIPWVKS